MFPFLRGDNSGRPHQTLYWRIDGMWAIRHGDLKVVHGRPDDSAPEWFDLAADIGEQRDLATAQPAKVEELKKRWNAWNAEQAPPEPAKDKGAKKATRAKTGGKKAKL